jgi:hypothetical protein
VLFAGWRGAPLAVVALVALAATRAFADLRPNRGEPVLPGGGKAISREDAEMRCSV